MQKNILQILIFFQDRFYVIGRKPAVNVIVDHNNGCESAGSDTPACVDEKERKLQEIIEKYKDSKGALIPVLHEAQEVYGYLPLRDRK
jgi:NADH:ubiquinone oxidoreductase subunit E